MKRTLIALWILALLLTNLAAPPAAHASATFLQPATARNEVHAFTLDNGLKVLLVARPNVPITIVDIWVGVGSISETPANNGIAHFFEHMVFKGTETRPGTVDLEIENLGGSTNAATSFDYTHYYIEAPSEHTAQALAILADITQNANFPEEEIVREKQVVLRERDQRQDNPGSFLGYNFFKEFYKTHPYGLPIVGTEEGLDPQSREDFLAFKERHYLPNNMTLVVVGDIDIEETLAVVEEQFGQMEPGESQPRSFSPETPLQESRVVEIEHDVNQGYMIFGWPAPSIAAPEEIYAMDVLLEVLSGGRGSRFYKNIQKELGIVTSVDAGYFTTRDPGTFTASAVFPYENRALVQEAIFNELQRILDGDLSAAEVERAKTMLLSNVALNHETNAGLAGTLGFYAIVADDYNFALTYPDGVRGVTVENIIATARKYIDLERYVQVVLIPQGFAEGDKEARAEAGLVQLDNGLKLILRKDTSTEVAAVQTFIGGGTSLESAQQAGLAELTQRLLLRGTKTRSEEELFEAIENLGAQLGQGTLPDMMNVSLVATGETWPAALPLYLDVLLNPAFSEEEFLLVKEEMLKEVEAQADRNGTIIFNNFNSKLYGPGGYGNPSLGTMESLQQITLDDVKEFYATYFAPNNMVVSAVGDFNPGLMEARLKARLGRLTPGREDLIPPPVQVALTDNHEVTVTKESNLTWLLVGFPAPSVADPDYPAMKMLNTVVGSGFTSRLFAVLREEQALAYSTSSGFPSRKGSSYFYAVVIALPENAQIAQEGILEILHDIQENGVTDEELARARNKAIADYVSAHETAERRAWYLGWYETLGAGVELDAAYPELLRTVTSEDLQRVASKYLQNYIVSSLGPVSQ